VPGEAVGQRGEFAMGTIGIVDFGSYLPARKLDTSAFELKDDPMSSSPLFQAPRFRHHKEQDQRASEMIELAARPMFERLGLKPSDSIDVIITNVLLPDVPITGCGAEVAHRLGCRPEWIVDLHNGGCAAFPYMLKLAQKLLDGQTARRALLCNVQNTAGTIFSQAELRSMPQAAVPGDGSGVAYVVSGEGSPVLAVEIRHEPQCAVDMDVSASSGRKYWQSGAGAVNVIFDAGKFEEIVARGNSLVPQVVRDLCRTIAIDVGEIDFLVTNQPNRLFLRNWQRELGIEPRRHLDTFDKFGNLYGAALPITFDHALREGTVRDGSLVVVAGFAHAGDFAAAAAIRWRGNGTNTDPVADYICKGAML
jgi:3-oxoacyl-[acyl-carrier-protein] synthase-3